MMLPGQRVHLTHVPVPACCALSQVVVIDEPGTVNAFVLPGGKICTFTGVFAGTPLGAAHQLCSPSALPSHLAVPQVASSSLRTTLVSADPLHSCLPSYTTTTTTGLINLFNRNEDMLATVIGHECAHAVARHTSEKLTLGIFVTLAVQVRGQGKSYVCTCMCVVWSLTPGLCCGVRWARLMQPQLNMRVSITPAFVQLLKAHSA